jgi:hypothetical protein
MPARVDDERFGRQQRFDIFKQEEPLFASGNQARGRRVQYEGRAFDGSICENRARGLLVYKSMPITHSIRSKAVISQAR